MELHNTYNWTSVGDTTPISNNLYADTSLPFPSTTWHYVIVTDSNGCQRTDSVQIEHMYPKDTSFLSILQVRGSMKSISLRIALHVMVIVMVLLYQQ